MSTADITIAETVAESSPQNTVSEYAETDFGYPGFGPYRYRPLSEPVLSSELELFSAPKTVLGVDALSIQTCSNPGQRNQDRYAVEEWDVPGGKWVFMSIFDGHAGHETADHAVANLPAQLQSALAAMLEQSETPNADAVSSLLKDAVAAYDDSLLAGLLEIFPGGSDELEKLSDDEIKLRINDSDTGGVNNIKVLRCLRGTTALISLLDSAGENIWVASLGDCAAVLGRKILGEWKATILSSNHNGTDADERARIAAEHPDEPEVLLRDRVIGAIAVTRALGDHEFKIPQIWTTRVFMNCVPGFAGHSKVEEFIPRNLTPPYVSKLPEVRHVSLTAPEHQGEERVLIMASDGLGDLYEARATFPQELADKWVRIFSEDGKGNLALRLLRASMGGEDTKRVSAFLTAEMDIRNMDDTTILVRRI